MRRPLLVVAEPCDVPLDTMTPRGRGRYCGKCDRVVENLSALTEREALARLAASGDDLCGTLAHDERGEPIFAPEPRRPWLAAVAVASTLAACAPDATSEVSAEATLPVACDTGASPHSNARVPAHVVMQPMHVGQAGVPSTPDAKAPPARPVLQIRSGAVRRR